jgi:hypothetical protein
MIAGAIWCDNCVAVGSRISRVRRGEKSAAPPEEWHGLFFFLTLSRNF